jgi:hypothetical protein
VVKGDRIFGGKMGILKCVLLSKIIELFIQRIGYSNSNFGLLETHGTIVATSRSTTG